MTEYVDLVSAAGRPGLPRHRLAVHLTAQSSGWAAPAAVAFEDAWRQEQPKRAEASAAARDTGTRDAERAAAYVAGVWNRTGAGPTWTELGEEFGWSPTLRARIIRCSRTTGC